MVAFARLALNAPYPLAEVVKDRLNDSGANAAWGEDWDFGRDLILNLTEGRKVYAVNPQGYNGKIWSDGLPLTGFSLHNQGMLDEVLSRLKAGQLYFVVVSKPWRKKKPYRLLHYHVGLFIPVDDAVYFYHSSKLSGTHGYIISSSQGRRRFQYQFKQSAFGDKKLLVLGFVD